MKEHEKRRLREKQTIHPIRFATEKQRTEFRKRLRLLQVKIDINKPYYQILYDLVTEELRRQVHTNSIGLTTEQFTATVKQHLPKITRVEETIE